MSRFRPSRREVPGLNTASLPDLIFTVLFFFMIVTHIKDDAVGVDYTPPKGSQVEKLAGNSSVMHIYIGHPAGGASAEGGGEMCVQINDRRVGVADIPKYIAGERSRMTPAEAQNVTVSLRADSAAPMGLVDDVKRALRSSQVLKIVYSAQESD